MDRTLIYDVGMNNGDDAAYYLHLGYRVVAIDADPTLVERAKLRFAKEIGDGRLTLVNAGIAATHSTMQFWVTEGNDVLSSFDRGMAERYGFTARPMDIQCCPFRDIVEKFGMPYYLKIDIEGNDHFCLADLRRKNVPAYLSLEVNHGLEEFLTLDRLGFNRFKLVLQNPHQAIALAPQQPTRLQRWWRAKIDRNKNRWRRRLLRVGLLRETPAVAKRLDPTWDFAYGSSGPFGELAPGPWLSLHDAIRALVDHRRRHRGDLWCDIHARHERLAESALSTALNGLGAAAQIRHAGLQSSRDNGHHNQRAA